MKKLLVPTVLAAAAASASAALASSSAPAVRFVTPTVNQTTPSTVVVRVALTNFSLDPADVGKRNKAHRGHLHFQMDGGKFDYPKYSGPNGSLAKTLGIAGKYSPSIAPTIVYSHLRPESTARGVPRQQRPLRGRPEGERHLHRPVEDAPRTRRSRSASAASAGSPATPPDAATRGR